MTHPRQLPFSLERVVFIRATPETVFRFFTDSARWAKWWGEGSTIDPRPGGRTYIKHPGCIEAGGEVLEIDPPRRFIFTYGYDSNPELPPGSSRVTITLEPHATGTRLTLTHELPSEAMRNEHVQGWRFQLSLFANAVADETHAGAVRVIDAWFAVWADGEEQSRAQTLETIATPDISMKDRFSYLSTTTDLLAHIAAAQRFMPGIRMRRTSSVRQCQGYALADYVATSSDGREIMKGTNIFLFRGDGLLESVVGITDG